MSAKDNKKYRAPRVEAAASEAGDRPQKTSIPTNRPQDPPTASAAASKANKTRTASDSGYSSKAHTSPSDSHSELATRNDAAQELSRSTPYANTHRPRKESLEGKKARPSAKAASSTGATAGKHRSSAPPPALWSNFHTGPVNALQIDTALTHHGSIPSPYPSSPAMYGPPYQSQQTSTSQRQYAPHPNYHQYPTSAPPMSAGLPPHAPGYFSHRPPPMPQDQAQYSQPRVPSFPHPGHHPPPNPQYQTYQPPPAPSLGFATPVVPQSIMPPPQRPALDSRHTMATIHQVQAQAPHYRHPQDAPSHHHQALVARRPSDSVEPRNTEQFYDPNDRKWKRWVDGRLQEWEAPVQRSRPALRRRKPRPRQESSESDTYDSEESSSSSESSSSEDEHVGRRSPRKALARRQTLSRFRGSPDRARRDSGQSADRQDLTGERRRLAAVAAYQDATATPRKQKARQPSFINDTARATNGGSPRNSDPPSPSVARSRVSETRSSNRGGRKSLILESDGPFGFRHDDQEFHVDAPHGQKVQLTINGRSEKHYIDEGSTGTSASRRRESTASISKGSSRNVKEMRDHVQMAEQRAATTRNVKEMRDYVRTAEKRAANRDLHDHHDADD